MDPRAQKYATQPDFYDRQEENIVHNYQPPIQHFYQSGSDPER